MKNLLFIMISVLSFSKLTFSQDNDSISIYKSECRSSFWINGGIGGNYFGLTFNGEISYSYNGSIFTFRFLKANEFTSYDPGGNKVWDEPSLSMKEFGILYGRSTRAKNLVLSLSGGLSYIDAVNRGGKIDEWQRLYEKVNIKTIGVPLELNVRIGLTDFLGIGGSCFGNLNSKKSFGGGVFSLYIGKF